MTIPPIPTDFSQLAQWLLMPAVLMLFASIIIKDFFSQSTDQQKSLIKFIVFIADGLFSYLLTRLAPDFVASIEPLWAILAGVIAAYYAPTVVAQVGHGVQLAGQALFAIGLRLAFGPAKAHDSFKALVPHA